MQVHSRNEKELPSGWSVILTVGFGTTVLMWAVGYVGHLFFPAIAKWPFLMGVLLISFFGGMVAGGAGGRVRAGFYAGVVTGLLNLLVVGSILGDVLKAMQSGGDSTAMDVMPSILLFGPGSVLVAVVLGTVGAWVGKTFSSVLFPRLQRFDFTVGFGWVAITATVLLIFAGGLVTGHKAGLSVPDWPNSFGYNMFLYPLSAMTGGIFYEHAHRLLGSLVGLTILTLAIFVTVTERKGEKRKIVYLSAWILFACVCLQGLMGGLRVTGKLTTSADPAAMTPSTTLAIIHGIFAHFVLAGLVALTAMISRRWRNDTPPMKHYAASTDLFFNWLLAGMVVLQTLLGALVRHRDIGLMVHIMLAALVTILALVCAMRAIGLYSKLPPMHRCAMAILIIVGLQVMAGIVALVVRKPLEAEVDMMTAFITTVHQTNAALLLAVSVALAMWTQRLLVFDPDAAAGEESDAVVYI